MKMEWNELMKIQKEFDLEAIMKDFKNLKGNELREGGFGIKACDVKGDCMDVGLISDEDAIQQALGKDIADITDEDWDKFYEMDEEDREEHAVDLYHEAVDEGAKELDVAKEIYWMKKRGEDISIFNKYKKQ